jgi:hypothetical protein
MDVLCVGMYRACSTWQYEVIAHLLERHRDGHRLGYVTGEEYAALDNPKGNARRWRVLKSHEGHRRFATALAKGRARAVYAHRDIRDVVFSLMHKRGVRFEDLLRQGMIHQILINDRFWRAQPGLLVQQYEDLITDPVTGVEELADHLGIALDAGEADEIAREYSFQANRERTLRLGARLQAAGVDLKRPANFQFYDGQTLLHWNHLREGRAGNWRTEATPRQRAILARLCNDWLCAHGYQAEPARATRRSLLATAQDEETLVRGWLACTLRCLSLRYPKTARISKRLLGIAPEPPAARPAVLATSTRHDAPESQAYSTPHLSKRGARSGSMEAAEGRSAYKLSENPPYHP